MILVLLVLVMCLGNYLAQMDCIMPHVGLMQKFCRKFLPIANIIPPNRRIIIPKRALGAIGTTAAVVRESNFLKFINLLFSA